MAIINPLVEGDIDAEVALKLITHTGHDAGVVYGRRGIGYIEAKVAAFNRSAHAIQYLAMVDLMDTGIDCAPEVVQRWLPRRQPGMHFRVVEHEIESWILADIEGLSDFLGVSQRHFDNDPDAIGDPKQTLVNLARRSARRAVKNALVPDMRSTAIVGPQYNVEVRRFVQSDWDPERARARSRSLHRCIARLAAVPV